jgi:hypothetical protein
VTDPASRARDDRDLFVKLVHNRRQNGHARETSQDNVALRQDWGRFLTLPPLERTNPCP